MREINLRPATLADVKFLADVVIRVTLAQGRFGSDFDEAAYRAGYEEWTTETVLGKVPDCALSVIQSGETPIGRFRVVRTAENITLAGLQILPEYQNQGIGTFLIEELKAEAVLKNLPMLIWVEKDNPNARRLYERLGFRQVGQDEREDHLEYRP